MRILTKDIPSFGLDIQERLSVVELNARPDEIKCLEPLVVSGRVDREANAFHAVVNAKTKFQYVCGRCLGVWEECLDQDFDFHYPIDTQVSYIDVSEDVREEIILGFPLKVLCDSNCKGLCKSCGANLNNERCKCGCKSEKL
jgi:uncharacterized protein